jgi:uncharacterized protein
VRTAAVLVVAFAAASCRPETRPPVHAEPVRTPSEPARPQRVVAVVPAGTPAPASARDVVFAEVVATPERRHRGLGGRERLLPDHGMLFAYPRAEERTFWMKDCLLALDIAFLGEDGRILRLATLPAAAGVADDDLPRASSGRPARYVLETEAGWFARHGVAEGDLVDVARAVSGVVPE